MSNAVDLAPTWHPIDITVLILCFVLWVSFILFAALSYVLKKTWYGRMEPEPTA